MSDGTTSELPEELWTCESGASLLNDPDPIERCANVWTRDKSDWSGTDILVGAPPHWRDDAKRLTEELAKMTAERDAYRRLAAQLCDDFELEFGLEAEDCPRGLIIEEITIERYAQVDRLAGLEVKA